MRVSYFLACIPHLKETGAITGDEELTLRRANTKRNLVIHSGLSISKEESEDAQEHVLKLIKKLRRTR
jgi:uncharacterized protein YutE (UPF0331/DUF86 family)